MRGHSGLAEAQKEEPASLAQGAAGTRRLARDPADAGETIGCVGRSLSGTRPRDP
jgi:hypothetical protein